MSPEDQRSPEFRKKEGEHPNFIRRKSFVKNYEINIKLKDDSKNTQQNSGRKSFHL